MTDTRESASTRPTRTAAIGRRSPTIASSSPIDVLIASSITTASEKSSLIKARRGIPLDGDDQARVRHLVNRLQGIGGGRPPVARPPARVSASDYRESQRELERLKKRHQAPAQTVGGQVVSPLATLKARPPAKLYVPSSHR